MICKSTVLLEYLNLLQNFHERNFHMILAYEINFATKMNYIVQNKTRFAKTGHNSKFLEIHFIV